MGSVLLVELSSACLLACQQCPKEAESLLHARGVLPQQRIYVGGKDERNHRHHQKKLLLKIERRRELSYFFFQGNLDFRDKKKLNGSFGQRVFLACELLLVRFPPYFFSSESEKWSNRRFKKNGSFGKKNFEVNMMYALQREEEH